MTTPAYRKAVLELANDMVNAFGENRVHKFGWQPAKSKSGGVKAVGTGPDAGKKPKYGKAAERALASGSKGGAATPVAKPKEAAAVKAPAADPISQRGGYNRPVKPELKARQEEAANRKAYNQRQYAGERLAPYAKDVDYTKPMGAGATTKAPAISPAETKAIESYHAKDVQHYGPRAAKILRGAAYALRGLHTFIGLIGGTMAGAALGGAVAGPLGMAVGTALGGGLGGAIGSRTPLGGAFGRAEASLGGPIARRRMGLPSEPTKKPSVTERAPPGWGLGAALTPGNRTRAVARKVARKVLPKAAGLMAAAPVAAVGLGAALAAPVAGAMVGGPVGKGVGVGAGMVLGARAGNAVANTAAKAAKQVRLGLATSDVSRRKAAIKNEDRAFSERFAEDGLPANAVALLKVRLKLAARKAGVALPVIPDDVIAKALTLASQDASTEATASNLSECVKLAERMNRFDFGSTRRDGEEWVTNGRKYRRLNGRTVRVVSEAGMRRKESQRKHWEARGGSDDRTTGERIRETVTDILMSPGALLEGLARGLHQGR